eukprot:704758-Pelagomonas_calceolata.AAC.3
MTRKVGPRTHWVKGLFINLREARCIIRGYGVAITLDPRKGCLLKCHPPVQPVAWLWQPRPTHPRKGSSIQHSPSYRTPHKLGSSQLGKFSSLFVPPEAHMQVEFLQEFKTTEDIGLPPKVQGGIYAGSGTFPTCIEGKETPLPKALELSAKEELLLT